MNYRNLVSHLINQLAFIKAVVIIEGKADVLYSTNNWNVASEITNIISGWESCKAHIIIVSEEEYVMRLYTEDRLVATSRNGKGHIIGVKDEVRTIIALIEPDGIIPYAFMEMSRILAFLQPRKSYFKGEDQFGQKANLIEKLSPTPSNMHKVQKEQKSFDETIGLTVIARLMAYYRALELQQESPLIKDTFAEMLAGDLSLFLDKHLRYSEMDYPIVRSYYIEEHLLRPWCKLHSKSQIVILGAGLDTRAYRFEPLKINHHKVFEVDISNVIDYKDTILKDYTPLCDLIRISADLNTPSWATRLIQNGFMINIPTFWIIEGLIYYMEQEQAKSLLIKAYEMSTADSQIFVDILHVSRWFSSFYTSNQDLKDPFSKHIKWGLDINTMHSFFELIGWKISSSFADDYDQGRNVGQKVMVFVQGKPLKN